MDDTLGSDRVKRWLKSRGLRNGTISKWGLGYVAHPARGHEGYRGMLTLPYLDGLGRERGLRFRRLRGKGPKYMSLGGRTPHLFGVRYTDEPVAYLTEGEIDCMTLHQIGLKAVGVPGAEVWKDSWRWLFRNTEEVVIVLDGDPPRPAVVQGRPAPPSGAQLFRMKVVNSLKQMSVAIRVVQMPPGEDANSLYVSDRKKLKELLT